MAKSDPYTVDALDAMPHMTVTLRCRNLWRVRLACWLLRLVGVVLRSAPTVVVEESDAPK